MCGASFLIQRLVLLLLEYPIKKNISNSILYISIYLLITQTSSESIYEFLN